MKEVIEAMSWRYSTNIFDQTKKLTDEDIGYLTEALRLSPSSFGLQPWRFIVITDPEIRLKLREAGYGQAKISEASHLIVFAIEKNINNELVDKFIRSVAEIRAVEIETLKGYGDAIKNFIAGKTDEARREWAVKQVYIALGVLITACATKGIDAGPMEGFDSKKFDKILGLEKLGLESRVMAAVGYRSESDPASKNKKVRFPKVKVVMEIK